MLECAHHGEHRVAHASAISPFVNNTGQLIFSSSYPDFGAVWFSICLSDISEQPRCISLIISRFPNMSI